MHKYCFSAMYSDELGKAIAEQVSQQCPNGYSMVIRNNDEWTAIAEAVNAGIDSYLQAITEASSFEPTSGECLVAPNEVPVLVRRLMNGVGETKEVLEAGESLASAICETLDIELV